MVATEFIDYLSKWKIGSQLGAVDYVDQFNCLITPMFLILCILIVTIKQYILKPIACVFTTMPDAGPLGNHFQAYGENMCWVEGTYALPITEDFGNSYSSEKAMNEFWDSRSHHKITYYQWVPFMLSLQCILFYLPRPIWQAVCHNRLGSDIEKIMNTASGTDIEDLHKSSEQIAKCVNILLLSTREYKNGWFQRCRTALCKQCSFLLFTRRMGSALMGMYLIIKCLYLANLLGQLVLITNFLGFTSEDYRFFGWKILVDIWNGNDWQQTRVFPRRTFCRVELPVLGAVHSYIATCALPGNMLNEKIYVFLWFWLIVLAVMTSLSVIVWGYRMLPLKNRVGLVKRYLLLSESYCDSDRPLVRAFISEYLRHDGVFLLQMMKINAGDIFTNLVTCKLFENWKIKHQGVDLRRATPSAPLKYSQKVTDVSYQYEPQSAALKMVAV